jgi:hypothetical protein
VNQFMSQAELEGLQELREVDHSNRTGAAFAPAFKALAAMPKLLDEIAYCRQFSLGHALGCQPPPATDLKAETPKKEDAK